MSRLEKLEKKLASILVENTAEAEAEYRKLKRKLEKLKRKQPFFYTNIMRKIEEEIGKLEKVLEQV